MIKYLLLLTILAWLTSSKRVVQQIKLNKLKRWHYFTKFGGDTGRNDYTLRFRLVGLGNERRVLSINMELYLDEEWPEALLMDECEVSRIHYSQRKEKTRRVEPFEIPTDGTYSNTFNGYLQSSVRAHMWYFVLNDCTTKLRESFHAHEMRSARLEIDFHILNTGDTEFSIEQFGMLKLQALMTIFDIVMLIYNARIIWHKYKNYDEFSLALFFLVGTLLLETLSYLFNLIHLSVYSYNGMGVMSMQVIAVLLQVCAQFCLTMILVMMSWGWYINFVKFDNFELFLPISLLFGFFQAAILGVGFLDYDSYYKDHNYEGWVGWVASSIYVGEFIYFMNGITETSRREKQKVKEFIFLLGLYGSLYFLSFPILQTVNLVVARYYRHRVMELGTMASRTVALVLLTRLFTSKKSIFSQISYDNKSILDRNKEL